MNPFRKRINFLYFLFIPVLYCLFLMNKNLGGEVAFFYGFAENKETEMNLDQHVLVQKICVSPGQEVSRGQLLMEVLRPAIDLKISEADYDLEKMEVISFQQKQQIRDRIRQLEAEKQSKISLTRTEIQQHQRALDLNRDLLEDLKSTGIVQKTPPAQERDPRILLLEQKLEQDIAVINLEIKQLQGQLAAAGIPSDIARKRLRKEIEFHKSERRKLQIYAPSDGLVGNIHCKKGEYVNAFSTLLNFYERNPTLVKGYVHESLIPKVSVDDSLLVTSSLHPSHKINGIVMGLGSRIVEIPERLRKIPEFKTYGREVLIAIPPANPFLQKEKVMLNSLPGKYDFLVTAIFSRLKNRFEGKPTPAEQQFSLKR